MLTLIESLRPGGAERLVATTLPRLDPARVSPILAYLSEPADLAPALTAQGVPVHRIGFRGPADIPGAVRRVRRLMRAEGVDVVHTHLYFANVVGRLASLGSVPVVSTLHNPDYTWEARPSLRFAGRKGLDRLSLRLARPHLIAVSEEVRRDYEKHFHLKDIEVLYNAIDVDCFRREVQAVDRIAARRALGAVDSDVVLLHVGRFHRQKGHDLLLEGFSVALREMPSLRLVLVGTGALQSAMRARAEQLQLGDRVLFVGSVVDMPRLYAAADLFVFPSRYEAFGLALLEAMAAGLPSVVSRVGGITEVASPEGSLTVDAVRAHELAHALVRLGRDAGLRTRMGAAAALHAQRFDVARMIPRLTAIYERL